MWSIFKKEVNSFLNSLIAYIVIAVFLVSMGLLVWVFPETSLLEYGYADLGVLFSMGPFVFLFLVPAICMRLFAEERKTGTLEWLLTKPLSEWQILLGKYFAAVWLVLFALLPTLIFYWSVYQLGSPIGNIDSAGTIGSYIGLLLIGAAFAAVGLFASAITENQIVAFILAVFLSFMLFAGISSLAGLPAMADIAYGFRMLGMDYHYQSLSKGLIDVRDVSYFVSLIVLFLLLTKWVLQVKR
jgi:ABC-2 type transport system permease protein